MAHHAATHVHRGVRFEVLSEDRGRCQYRQVTKVGPFRLAQEFDLQRVEGGPLINTITHGQFTGGTISFDIQPDGADRSTVEARFEADVEGLGALASPLMRRTVTRALDRALAEDRHDLESGNYPARDAAHGGPPRPAGTSGETRPHQIGTLMTTPHGSATALRIVTSTALAAASALHVAWGLGSTFPYRSDAQLTDRVVGSRQRPSPASCYTVAGALGTTAALAASTQRSQVRRGALLAAATVFATRAAFGFSGRTDLLVPGSTSPAFRRQDRRIYSPICLALAGGLAHCARQA